MTKSSRLALFAGLVLAAVVGLFPPWTYTVRLERGLVEKPAPRAPLFAPPPPESPRAIFGVRLDAPRLAVEWAVLGSLAGAAALLTRRRA